MSVVVTHKSASVTLRPIDYKTVWIANLYAEERGKGHTRELMQLIVDKADRDHIFLQVDARAENPAQETNTGAIIIFYEDYEFRHITGGGQYLMARVPKLSQEKQPL